MTRKDDNTLLGVFAIFITFVFLIVMMAYAHYRIDELSQEVKTLSNSTVTRDFCFSACLKELCEGDECSTDPCACWDICEAGRPKPPHCFAPFYK